MSAALCDHDTRVVALAAKDTTEKRAASSPREYRFTSSLARAIAASIRLSELLVSVFFIEPLSSIINTKSTRNAQGGLGDGGGGLGEGGGGDGGGGGEGGGGMRGDGGGGANPQVTTTRANAASPNQVSPASLK